MDLGQELLRRGVVVAALLVVIALAAWARRHPNHPKGRAERTRLPVVVAIGGWLLLGAGLVLSLVVFTAEPPVGALVSAAMGVLAGAGFLFWYRNWWFVLGAEAIYWSDGLGRRHELAYREIVEVRERVHPTDTVISVRGAGGPWFRVGTRGYDATALTSRVEFHRRHGRWPGPGELPE